MTEAKELPGRATQEYLYADPAIVRTVIISETFVFCTLALLGGGLFALVAITNLNWYYPTVFYGGVAYIAWQRYFISVNLEVARAATQAVGVGATQESTQEATQAAQEMIQHIKRVTQHMAQYSEEIAEQTEQAAQQAAERVTQQMDQAAEQAAPWPGRREEPPDLENR